MGSWRPINDWHLVDLVKPLDMTAGGIALPERMTYNDTTAVVLDSGPGRPSVCGYRSTQWAEPGDVVLMDKDRGWWFKDRQYFIRDCDLLARMDGDTIIPMNDFVYVEPDAGASMVGSIEVPDAWRRNRARTGIVRAVGHGEFQHTGHLAGLRKSIASIINSDELRKGTRVYWEHESNAVAVGQHSCDGLLVRAKHLIAIEEED